MEKESFLKIVESIIYLRDKNNYVTINKGDFKKAPLLEGYYIDLYPILKNKVYLILNTNKKYDVDKNTKEINNKYYFIVMNLYAMEDSLDDFVKNINKHFSDILKLMEYLYESHSIDLEDEDQEGKQHDLPYGYTRDKNGNIIVNKEEADLARKTFMAYAKEKSMKRVSNSLRSSGHVSRKGEPIEFSVVSGILHDNRYISKDLPQAIIPASLFKKVQDVLRRNTKDNKIMKFY